MADKKYNVEEFYYTYCDKDHEKDRSVRQFRVRFDSLADIESQLECDLGQITKLVLKVRD
jgi:hypothetical protein